MRLRESTLGVVGLGLLGASLGKRLQETRGAKGVLGWDIDPEVRRKARERQMVDDAPEYLEKLVTDCDVLVLAVPMRRLDEANAALQGAVRQNARLGSTEWPGVILDLSSARRAPAEKLRRSWGSRYIGFHPMAGSEKTGIDHARADLFEGATCVVVPTPESSAEAIRTAEELAATLGAKALRMDAAQHDAIVAATSHLPLLAAAALALTAGSARERHPDLGHLVAGGFRDTTRVAGGPPGLGADMMAANGDEIRAAATEFLTTLQQMLVLDTPALEALLDRARAIRTTILESSERSAAA